MRQSKLIFGVFAFLMFCYTNVVAHSLLEINANQLTTLQIDEMAKADAYIIVMIQGRTKPASFPVFGSIISITVESQEGNPVKGATVSENSVDLSAAAEGTYIISVTTTNGVTEHLFNN